MLWMIRTQVQLNEPQAEKLKRIAAARGVSMAEVIREAVDRLPDRDDRSERWARARAMLGTFHDVEGRIDVSVRHDEYLADALEADLHREHRRP
jgi:Arc/MetJ-type ribon-helix-helix transcriptional regulator